MSSAPKPSERAEPKSIAPAFPGDGERAERLRQHGLAMLAAQRARYMDEYHEQALATNRAIDRQRTDPDGVWREIRAQRKADEQYAINQEKR